MKVLMVSSYLPYPLFSGGQVRLYNLIKELSARHEITLICEMRHHQTEKDIKEVEKICKKVITVDRHKQWSFKNIVKTGLSSHSFLLNGHTHKLMQVKIKELLETEKFDLIHVETFYVMQNLPTYVIARIPIKSGDKAIPLGIREPAGDRHAPLRGARDDNKKIPIVLIEHNIEYKVYNKFMNRVPLVLRPILSLDIAKIKKEEEDFWRKATRVIAVSLEDQKVIEKQGIKAQIVSNGVNTDQFSYKSLDRRFESKDKERKILFIGDFSWIQNKDAVTFIIKEIWPEVNSKLKTENLKQNVKLWIVGRKIPDAIKSLTNDPTVLFDEKSSAKTAPEIFQEADVLLAPLRVGGGTSYKILEAMSCGTPVATMQMSAHAIGAKDGQELMVGKDTKELAEKTVLLLNDSKIYERVSRNGRKFVQNNYTWKAIAKMLEDAYISAVA